MLDAEPHPWRPAGPTRRRLDALIDDAARRIDRLSPRRALAVSASGGAIVDIRALDARARDGIIPGSLHIPRTVLEWRIAPDSPWRNHHLGGVDERLILVCDHGYSSILAAANLVELGFHRAGDVIGGFAAWAGSGLPIVPSPREPSWGDGLPGSGPPDVARAQATASCSRSSSDSVSSAEIPPT